MNAFNFLLFLFLQLSFNNPTPETQKQQKQLRVLFVGNSLTYYNDLPSMVGRAAKEHGLEVQTEMVAKPNFALEDHWNDGQLQRKLDKGTFDWIVLQQGPSSQPEGLQMLLKYGGKVKNMCKHANCQVAFFMVWPSRQHYASFPMVIANYRNAATTLDVLLFPVGEEWKEYQEKTADFSYYAQDGFHPSTKGSQIAARIIANQFVAILKDSD